MHHLLQHAAPAQIALIRPHPQILVPELAPHAEHLDPFRRVTLHQKVVSHCCTSFIQLIAGASLITSPRPFRRCYPNPQSTPCRPAPNHYGSPSTPAAPSPIASGSRLDASACSRSFPRPPILRRPLWKPSAKSRTRQISFSCTAPPSELTRSWNAKARVQL